MSEIDAEAVIRRALVNELGPGTTLSSRPRAANRPAGDSQPAGREVFFWDIEDTANRAKIAAMIRSARALLDWSQARLASEADLTIKTIQRVEKAQKVPAESTISSVFLALAKAGIELTADGAGAIGVRLSGDGHLMAVNEKARGVKKSC